MPVRTMHDNVQRMPKGAAEARTILQRRGGYIMTFYKVSPNPADVVGT